MSNLIQPYAASQASYLLMELISCTETCSLPITSKSCSQPLAMAADAEQGLAPVCFVCIPPPPTVRSRGRGSRSRSRVLVPAMFPRKPGSLVRIVVWPSSSCNVNHCGLLAWGTGRKRVFTVSSLCEQHGAVCVHGQLGSRGIADRDVKCVCF